ncbi:DEKNAAC103396 [Brettanomyces naardenensis]|uniref:DEKNAAC103397 n=1 Tax=Brettanomyces naardenensis TaxID=13370 RepID=A0A448YNX1_BRENA|nr:DEKNAAC103396 [Brettanomyces naardenensis]
MVTATSTSTSAAAHESKALDITERYQISEKLINEEFKIWKKTSPMLYDFISTYSLDWPSLTVQWLKETTNVTEANTNGTTEEVLKAKLLLGTNTTGNEQNYLQLYSVDLPPTLAKGRYGSLPVSDLAPLKGNNTHQSRLNLVKKWRHPGEINKVRIDETIGLIATQTNSGDVLVYDYRDSSSDSPDYTLKFHTNEGFGLEWNPLSPGLLLSGNEDFKIALWDLSSRPSEKTISKPYRSFKTHSGIVNDVSWNSGSSQIFASVSDDGSLQIHDLRARDDEIAIRVDNAHDGSSINAVEFHPLISSFLATGSTDNFVQCWDLRDYSKPVRRLYGHTGPVLNLKFNNNLLLSTSVDRRVLIWDLNKIAEGEFDLKEYEKKKSDYTDPCLVFMHGGHTGRLCEADWHPHLDNVVISCAEDSLVEIWRPLHIEDSFDDEDEEGKADKDEAEDLPKEDTKAEEEKESTVEADKPQQETVSTEPHDKDGDVDMH